MYTRGQKLSVIRYSSSLYDSAKSKQYNAIYEDENDRYYILSVCKSNTWDPIYRQTEPKVDEKTGNLEIRLVL